MEAYRLSKTKYCDTLSGYGAALKGARWNSQGVEMVYVASNRSLAMAEVAVHFSLGMVPPDYVMMTLHIPDDVSSTKLTRESLPADWDFFPHSASTQSLGNAFIFEKKHCMLQVPSAVTRGDYNLLLNPAHPDFTSIKIIGVEKFPFDLRLIK